ncbi:MAG: protein phosphatase 2C domain-containing protein, partial [Streptosporangiaceae bacterium]
MTTTPARGDDPPEPPAWPAAALADPPGLQSRWLVLTASERGASHVANRSPNQDAVATERAGGWGVVAAVADGHGHPRHLRSARGSKLAVKIGCQVAQELADRLESAHAIFAEPESAGTAAATAEEITKLVGEILVPAVVSRWRESVLADVKADPFSDAEQTHRHFGDNAIVAYGSTLLLAMVLHGWLILAQIGDGDVVGVRADGRAIEPVPADPQLDGLVTTSLCGSDPRADFRVAAVDTAQNQLAAVLLATDGYGNAQVVEQWPEAFSEDLALMLRDREVNWLASQLPSWAARCASADGSADDTTVALLLSPAARRAGSQESDPGSEETTIPAVPHADTVPIQLPPPPEPVSMRQLANRAAREPVILERSAPS